MASYPSYRVAAWLSRRLPARMAYWVGLRIADLYYAFSAHSRRAVHHNLAQVLRWRGVEPARSAVAGLTRKTFQYYGKYLVDFFRCTQLTAEDMRDSVSLEHPERLASAHGAGRGVIIATAHLGNWEMGAAVLKAMGYSLTAVVAPARLPRLERLLRRQREERGMHVVPVGHSARHLLRALKRGELVGLLADRDFSHEQQSVELFGKTVHMPRGPAWLALHSGAPILPAFLLRQEDDTFLFRLHEPIVPKPGDDVTSLSLRLRDVLQEAIGACPHQWFIFHDFWAPEPVST